MSDAELAKALREEMQETRRVLMDHGEKLASYSQVLKMLPCAGHEIRINKVEDGVSRVYGAGAVVSVVVLILAGIVAALIG